MKAWRVHAYGAPADVLQLDDIDVPEAGDGELLVRVEAVTLNFNDLDGIRGRYKTVPTPVPYVPGMEVYGTVERGGTGTDEWVGRRVVGIPSGAFGGYAEYASVPTSMAFVMPDSIELPDAAAIFMPFHLGWLALYERARLERGETLLVHGGAGGAGSAAIQLGARVGARVIATAGSEEKLARCRDLGADLAIDHRDGTVVEQVLAATEGRGVDVAFDTIGGPTTLLTFRCMAFNGRHVIAGFASGIDAEDEGIVPRPILFGNFSLVGVCHAYVEEPVTFRQLTGFNFPSHRSGEALHAELCAAIVAGELRPIVGKELSFVDLPAGLAAMERRETVGRIVVRLDI